MDKLTLKTIIDRVTNNGAEEFKLYKLMADGEWQSHVDNFVRNNVIHCASYMVSELASNETYQDNEDLLNLYRSEDWETPVDDYLTDQADYSEKVDFLEYMNIDVPTMQLTVATDNVGEKWSFQTGDNSFTGGAYGLPHWAVVEVEHDSDTELLHDEIIRQLSDLVGSDKLYCSDEIEEWIGGAIDDFTETVEDLIDQSIADWAVSDDPDYQYAADYLNIDPEYNEIFEHWIVNDWFAGEMAKRGETTGELLGFTIWGRGTTGQGISMDSVVNRIYFDMVSE